MALALAAVVGIATGVVSAVWPNSFFDALSRLSSLFGLSMPVFWTGLVLIVRLRILAAVAPGRRRRLARAPGAPGRDPRPAVDRDDRADDALQRPRGAPGGLRADRAGQGRRRAARGGLKHALRNAAIPILTLVGLQAGQLMGGAVLTETVFAWPGLGRLMVKAIFARDYVLLQGAVLIFAMAFVVINLVVDLSYGMLDPRVSRQG